MAAPVDAGRIGTNIATAVDPLTINQPGSIAAGDLLIMMVREASSVVATAGTALPGWSTLIGTAPPGTPDSTDAAAGGTWIYWKKATGSEGATETLDLVGGTVKAAALVWRITGAADPNVTPPQVTSTALFTTAANTANPGSISPTGGSKDYLFLILAGCDSETVVFTHGVYTDLTSANSGTGGAATTNCVIAGASLQKTASTEDPAAFTHAAATTGGSAWTIAIHPAAAAGTAHTRTPADTLTLADTFGRLRASTRTPADTIALLDSVKRQKVSPSVFTRTLDLRL